MDPEQAGSRSSATRADATAWPAFEPAAPTSTSARSTTRETFHAQSSLNFTKHCSNKLVRFNTEKYLVFYKDILAFWNSDSKIDIRDEFKAEIDLAMWNPHFSEDVLYRPELALVTISPIQSEW